MAWRSNGRKMKPIRRTSTTGSFNPTDALLTHRMPHRVQVAEPDRIRLLRPVPTVAAWGRVWAILSFHMQKLPRMLRQALTPLRICVFAAAATAAAVGVVGLLILSRAGFGRQGERVAEPGAGHAPGESVEASARSFRRTLRRLKPTLRCGSCPLVTLFDALPASKPREGLVVVHPVHASRAEQHLRRAVGEPRDDLARGIG